jgi:hypothetical protein
MDVRAGEMQIFIAKPPSDEAFEKYHIDKREAAADAGRRNA